MTDKNKAVDTATSFLNGVNMVDREKEILTDVSEKTGFEIESNIWKSTYYGSDQIGAALYQGVWKGKPAVLKIQGVKPEISEIVMVEGFAKQNKSRIVRPPEFFTTLPWNEKLEYEAILMEKVTGEKIIDSKRLQTKETLDRFFGFYEEYRANCINKPWIGESEALIIGEKEKEKTKAMVAKLKPESKLRRRGDQELTEKAVEVLNRIWKGKKSEFMHGHFSAEDLICQGDQVVLFSNLFWKWKHKFYDAVFAYHYCMIGLSQIEEVNNDIFDTQRDLWLEKIYNLPTIKGEEDIKMVNAALLERMMACLLVDGIMFVKEDSLVADHVIQSTRDEISRLISLLS